MIRNSHQGPRGHTYDTKQTSRSKRTPAWYRIAIKVQEDTNMILNRHQGPRGHEYDIEQPSRSKRTRV